MGTEFRKDVVTLIPRASHPARKFGELSFAEIQKLTTRLTEEEKQSPYADLYEQENALSKEQERVIEGPPMNRADAFEPEDYGIFMNRPGHCQAENGYCILESGIAYSAVLIRQPGRTNEKMEAYNREFAVEGALAYKIWCPGSHYYHYSDGAVEDFGYGLLNMKNMLDEENYCNGIDITKLGICLEDVENNDPDCLWIGGNYWKNYPILANGISDQPIDMIIVNYLRKTEYGRELRIRMFGGAAIENGRIVRTKMPEMFDKLECARLHMKHLMMEYGNEARLVNQFWERRKKSLHREVQ